MIPIPGPLRLTPLAEGDVVRIELHGSLGHQDADALLDTVTGLLAEPARAPRDLYVGCAGVSAVDSSGLSVLLMVRRATDAAGVRLHLEARPLKLERMLTLTGTLEHFTSHIDSRTAAAGVPDTT